MKTCKDCVRIIIRDLTWNCAGIVSETMFKIMLDMVLGGEY